MKKSLCTLTCIASALLAASTAHADELFYESGWSIFPEGQSGTVDSTFGRSLQTHQNLLFVGTGGADGRSVLVYNTNDWTVVRRITPNDAPSHFGSQIETDGERIWISGTDAVYVFELSTGNQLHKFTEPAGDTLGEYGGSFAIAEDRLYVGDLAAPVGEIPETEGVVYIYDTTDNTLIDTLVSEGLSSSEDFGTSVQADGDLLFVAAPNDSYLSSDGPFAVINSGSVLIFDRFTLEQVNILRTGYEDSSGGAASFGPSFTVNSGKIIVQHSVPGCQSGSYPKHGSWFIDISGGSIGNAENISGDCFGTINFMNMYSKDGIAVLDRRSSDPTQPSYSHWIQVHDLSGPAPSALVQPAIDLENSTSVSESVGSIKLAFSSRYLFVGLGSASDSEGLGRVVVIEATCNYAFRKADINEDNTIDVFDVFGFLDLWTAQDPEADLVTDGVWDIFDVFAYLDYYSEACR